MSGLGLDVAQTMVSSALSFARKEMLKPLAVAVLDHRGTLKAFAADDGTSLRREQLARGKAEGALAMGMGTRAMQRWTPTHPHLIMSSASIIGSIVPLPGGVLVKDEDGRLLGAVGVSGDSSDNDERVAVAAIEAAALQADPGSVD